MLETHADQMTVKHKNVKHKNVKHGTHILTKAEEEIKYEVPRHWKGQNVLCLL